MPEMAPEVPLALNGHIIYGLVDPRTRLVRYVGQTSNVVNRLAQHRYKAKSNPSTYRDHWIRQLTDLGLRFETVLLERVDNRVALDPFEQWWIAFGRACGWPLTNIGEGGRTCVMSAETRQKISAKAIARGPRKQSDEERAQRSVAMQGQQRALGNHHTDDAKARIASSRAGKAIRFKGDRPKLRINLLGDNS